MKQNFYYFFYFMFFMIMLKRLSEIFTYKNIIYIGTSLLIVYIIYIYNEKNTIEKYIYYHNSINLIDNYDLIYLLNNAKILKLYIDIIGFKNENLIVFNNSMKDMNLFLKNYNDLINNPNNMSKHVYEYALYRRNMAINHLLSLIVNSSTYNSNIIILKNTINKIRKITLNYLKKMEVLINDSWNNDDINIFSGSINSSLLNPNPINDIGYQKNFSIY